MSSTKAQKRDTGHVFAIILLVSTNHMLNFILIFLITLVSFVPASAAIDPQLQAIVKQELGAELRADGLAQQGAKT